MCLKCLVVLFELSDQSTTNETSPGEEWLLLP